MVLFQYSTTPQIIRWNGIYQSGRQTPTTVKWYVKASRIDRYVRPMGRHTRPSVNYGKFELVRRFSWASFPKVLVLVSGVYICDFIHSVVVSNSALHIKGDTGGHTCLSPNDWQIISHIPWYYYTGNYNKKHDCSSRVVMVTDEKPQILNCNIQFYFKRIVQTITFKLCDKT